MRVITPVALAICLLAAHHANADIYFSEIDLANNIVEIVNDGGGDVDMTTWWLCNRVNGSPFYATLAASVSINAATFEASGTADLIVEAGDVLVLDVLDPDFLPDTNGEFSFYNTNSFSSAAAIEDYIAWGGPGVRDVVAEAAGIWIDNDFIDVTTLGVGETIQLKPFKTGSQSSDYFFAASDLGNYNAVPEPSSVVLLACLSGIAAWRRRR